MNSEYVGEDDSETIEGEDMVKVDIGDHHYTLDGYHKSNLDVSIKEVRRKNYDRFILYCGREGYGKSTKALQDALYLDHTFNIDRVCFTPEQFLEAVEKAERFQAIVFDETVWALGSRDVMSRMKRVLIKIMSEMRSKNLFVLMCIPNFFMMDWYVAQHRSSALIYIYKRGCFASYNYPKKKELYMKGKKTHSYSVSPNFICNFTKYFPIDKEEYEKRKQEAINSFVAELQKSSRWREQRDILIKECINKRLMTEKEISELINLSKRQILALLRPNGENDM